MKHLRVLDKITWVFYVVLFVALVIVGWEYFYPLTIIEVKSLKVLNAPVQAGEYLQYEICYTKYRPFPAKVILTLNNSTSQTIRVSDADSPCGTNCKRNYVRIPKAMDEDVDYRLGWEAIYHPTNLAEKSYRVSSDPFEVKAAPPEVVLDGDDVQLERLIKRFLRGPKVGKR